MYQDTADRIEDMIYDIREGQQKNYDELIKLLKEQNELLKKLLEKN